MHDPRETRRLVAEMTGSEPLEMRNTDGPDTWFVELADGREVVVKRPGFKNRPGSVRVEAWAYQACAERGVRVPRLLGVSIDPVCLVIERLHARPLERGDTTTVARAIWADAGADLRKIHEISLDGYGPLVPGDDAPRGESATWSPWVEFVQERGIAWLVDASYIPSSVGSRLLQRFDEPQPLIRGFAGGHLLHSDLQSGHIFHSDPGGYRAIIDFGLAQSGDPRWDLARVLLWDDDPALDALLIGYGDDVLTRDDRELLLPLYLFAFATKAAVGHSMPDYIRLLLDRSRYASLL